MRSREEIQENIYRNFGNTGSQWERKFTLLVLSELLLDIRDLLTQPRHFDFGGVSNAVVQAFLKENIELQKQARVDWAKEETDAQP